MPSKPPSQDGKSQQNPRQEAAKRRGGPGTAKKDPKEGGKKTSVEAAKEKGGSGTAKKDPKEGGKKTSVEASKGSGKDSEKVSKKKLDVLWDPTCTPKGSGKDAGKESQKKSEVFWDSKCAEASMGSGKSETGQESKKDLEKKPPPSDLDKGPYPEREPGCFGPVAAACRKVAKKFRTSPNKFANSVASEMMADAMKLKDKSYPGNANIFIDHIIGRVVSFMRNNGFDPLYLGNFPNTRWVYLEGLTSMKRVGNSTMVTTTEDISVKGVLGFRNVGIRCAVNYKVWWDVWVIGIFHVFINELFINGDLKVNYSTSRKGDLTKFYVPDWGNMDLTVKGENWLAKIIGFFNNLYPEFFRQNVRKRLPGIVKKKLDELLEKFEFPAIKKLNVLQRSSEKKKETKEQQE